MPIRYLSGLSVDSTVLVVDAVNDRVGIGTASPATALDVNGTISVSGSPIAWFSGNYNRIFRPNGTVGIYLGNATDAGNYYDNTTHYFRSSAGSSVYAVIDYLGNVGIGTTSPAAKLDVNGTISASGEINSISNNARISLYRSTGTNYFDWSSGQPLYFSTETTAGGSGRSTKMVLLDNGNVGIGTTSPSQKLEVSGALVVGMTTPAPFWNALFKDYNDGSGVYISSVNGGGGKYIAGNAYYYNSALWRSDKTVASAINLDNGTVVFYTNSGLTANTDFTPTERMRITEAGNVGIGTTSPANTLQIGSVGATGYSGNRLAVGDGTNVVVLHPGAVSYLTANGDIVVGAGGNTTNQLYVKSGGNVGIGTTTPANALDIATPTATLRLQSTTGANTVFAKLENTAGTFYIGRDNSVGTAFGFANAATLYETGANPMVFVTNSAERMRIDSTGNLMLGVTSVYGGGAQDAKFTMVGGAPAADAARGNMILMDTKAYNASPLFSIMLGGQFNSSNSTTFFGGIAGGKENATDNDYAGFLSLYTRANGGGRSEAVRITSAGNVGIGTTSPSVKLHTVGDGLFYSNTNTNLTINSNGGAASLTLTNSAGSQVIYGGVGGSNNMDFYTGSAFRMRIDPSGNVGIGTTSPANKLVVTSDASPTSENSYSIAAASASDPAYKTVIGYDFTNDIGLIAAVRTGIGWRNISMPQGSLGLGNIAPTEKLHVTGNIRVTGAYYDSSNDAGSSGQVLSSTGSGTDWITPSTTTATSLYDLLPAARVAYNWVGQVVNDTWTTVFSKSSNLLTTGTWMVKMYVSDFSVGGQHYTYTYSGMFTWYQDTTNQGGEPAASEIYLHRMGHAANASVLYLRTTETSAASSGDGLFQIKGNYSNTSNQTIQFQFVKIL